MKKTKVEDASYVRGYIRGVDDALMKISNWVDEETLRYARDILLGDKELEEKDEE